MSEIKIQKSLELSRSLLTDRNLWIGALTVGLVVAYIDIGRRQGIAVPIPFLLLLGVVVLVAALGGKRAGIVGALVSSGYIYYSMTIGFGPATLTGGLIQVLLGSCLMLVVGYFLGQTRDQNRRLIGELEKSHQDLEARVVARTAELTLANELLLKENEERLATEAALHSRDIYYQRLIENALDIFTVMDAEANIIYESPSIRRVLGYEQDELVGQNAFHYIHPDDINKVRKEFEGAMKATRMSRTTEFRFRHKDGSWRILETIGNNLLNDPVVSGLVINARDITNRRKIEEQAQRQNSLAVVGQLAAGIAHDFNNVMAVILLYAQLLERSPNLNEKEKKQLKTIIKEGMRAAGLTAQILDFGRQTVLDPRDLDLVPFMEEFKQLLELTLPDRIRVELTFEESSHFVRADGNRLQQAFMNLALNSRDAMPEGGLLRIELHNIASEPEQQTLVDGPVPDGWVKIIFIDEGAGISREGMKHLFEPFFTTKEPGKGTGLGLPQVYGIVKQHNGFVDVDTEVGVGTRFGILLPKVSGEETAESMMPAQAVSTGNGEWLLVVENNDSTRMALLLALESLNYKVFGVRSGQEALNLLTRHPEMSLVISDVVMPDMDGIMLTKEMEALGIETPVILLSGKSASEEMESLMDAGRVEIFSRPIPLQTLGRIIERYLRGKITP